MPETAPAGPAPDAARPTDRPRSIGLVLGAGGVAGYAFHTGVLAALADAGWDARTAELIIGTSAGAGSASLLRGGLSPRDHFAHTRGLAMSAEGDEFVARLPEGAWDSGELAPAAPPRPAAATLAVRSLLRWPPRPGLTVAGALPRGRRSTEPMSRRHHAVHHRWPDDALWVCAVRLRDGRRVVFGRDDHPPLEVGDAVAASSAIPGVFTPVPIGGEEYVDGGVWSMTNADLTRGLGYDAVVVSAPLSGPESWKSTGRSAGAAYRAYHLAVLEAEIRRVRDAGTPVLALRPTVEDLAAFRQEGDGLHRGAVAEQAHRSVTRRLEADPGLLPLLTDPVAVKA